MNGRGVSRGVGRGTVDGRDVGGRGCDGRFEVLGEALAPGDATLRPSPLYPLKMFNVPQFVTPACEFASIRFLREFEKEFQFKTKLFKRNSRLCIVRGSGESLPFSQEQIFREKRRILSRGTLEKVGSRFSLKLPVWGVPQIV